MKNFKNIMKICLMSMFMLFTLTGCVVVSISDMGQESVNGTGQRITKEYSVSEYSAVKINGNMEVVYIADDLDVVTVEIQENLLEYLDISVEDDELTIQANKTFITDRTKTPIVYITIPTLNKLSVNGGAYIRDSDPVQSETFTFIINGASKAELEIYADSIMVEVNGAGSITLFGTATEADISINGAGNVDALKLQTENASVRLDGAGRLSIACSENLIAEMNGIGSIAYKGDPSVKPSISGIGTINQVK